MSQTEMKIIKTKCYWLPNGTFLGKEENEGTYILGTMMSSEQFVPIISFASLKEIEEFRQFLFSGAAYLREQIDSIVSPALKIEIEEVLKNIEF